VENSSEKGHTKWSREKNNTGHRMTLYEWKKKNSFAIAQYTLVATSGYSNERKDKSCFGYSCV
jgi:hypothetical protein